MSTLSSERGASRTLTRQSQQPSISPSGAPIQRRRTKLSLPEKKIAEDEFMAAAIGDVEWLRQSLRGTRGVVNFDKNGLAPIHLASIHARLDCLKLLIEKFKVDVNLPSSTGWRPVHLVISNQTGKRAFNCMLYLLQQGADPSATNADGISALHQASSEGHVQCLKALLEVGAPVEQLDRRGHTPMDLAKLWGHRKCARILAAEQWHQDKEFISQEMKQLQKMKIQQVLKELEEDEEIKADQQFYGEIAFNQWLQKRGLSVDSESEESEKPASSGKKASRENSKVKSPPAVSREGTQKANSFQKSTSQIKHPPILEEQSEQTTPRPETPGRTQVVTREDAEESRSLPCTPRSMEATFLSTQSEKKSKENCDVENSGEQDEDNTYNVNLVHSKPWNKSTKVYKKPYITNLGDYYPRDEFTMMPISSPKRERSTLSAVITHETERRNMSAESKRVKMPKLPKDVIDKALSKDKAVVFKCKNVLDSQKRRMLDWSRFPRSESGMHMTNDLTSLLFQNGLLPERIPSTPSTAISGISDWSDDVGVTRSDIPAILKFIKQVSQPTDFPKFSGRNHKYTSHV